MSQFSRDLARQIILSESFVESMTEMMAAEIEKQLRGQSGGERIYIPKTASREDKAVRNHLIRAQFTGRNHVEIARRYHLTVRQVRRIVCSSDIPD